MTRKVNYKTLHESIAKTKEKLRQEASRFSPNGQVHTDEFMELLKDTIENLARIDKGIRSLKNNAN